MTKCFSISNQCHAFFFPKDRKNDKKCCQTIVPSSLHITTRLTPVTSLDCKKEVFFTLITVLYMNEKCFLIIGSCSECLWAELTKHDQQTPTAHSNDWEKGIFGIFMTCLHLFFWQIIKILSSCFVWLWFLRRDFLRPSQLIHEI